MKTYSQKERKLVTLKRKKGKTFDFLITSSWALNSLLQNRVVVVCLLIALFLRILKRFLVVKRALHSFFNTKRTTKVNICAKNSTFFTPC